MELMLNLDMTYQEAATLLQFLDIRVEVIGQREPELCQVRNKLIGEVDNYEQIVRMLPSEEKQREWFDSYWLTRFKDTVNNCTIQKNEDGLFYWCYGESIRSDKEVAEVYPEYIDAVLGLCRYLEICLRKSDELINDVISRVESIS
ncbi:hypothetical protein H6G27_09965 [Nostoc linckia FACHB-104]|nr:hypothetical protein [Nostoc linckia FACHB-104]